MKYRIAQHRLTIPQEIREKANIPRNGIIEIYYDEKTGNVVISSKLREDEGHETKLNVSSPRKIEANFMDADKLSRTCYSECGLIVRTKNRYVSDFCEDCQGQLAKEWENRVDVQCSYLSKKSRELRHKQNPKVEEKKIEESKNKDKEKKKEEKKKEDIEIKVIKNLVPTEHKKRGRPKKQNRYSTGATTLKPVATNGEEAIRCAECGEFVVRGFMLDDDFLCKECAKADFKNYLKRMRGN